MNNTCIGVGSSKGEWKEYDSYEGERNHCRNGESKARKKKYMHRQGTRVRTISLTIF